MLYFAKSFLCPEKLLQVAQPGSLQGENPVKAGGGRAAVREDETGMNQCARPACEGAGSRLIPEPEELREA
jgi:hypothetical protein